MAEVKKYPDFLGQKTREFSKSYVKLEPLGRGAFAEVWLCTKKRSRSETFRRALQGAASASKRVLQRMRSQKGSPRSLGDGAELDQSERGTDLTGSTSAGDSLSSPFRASSRILQRMQSWGQGSLHSSPGTSSHTPPPPLQHQESRTYHGGIPWNPATIDEGSPLESVPPARSRVGSSLHGPLKWGRELLQRSPVEAGHAAQQSPPRLELSVLEKQGSEATTAETPSPSQAGTSEPTLDLSFLGRPASETTALKGPSPSQTGTGGPYLPHSSSSPGPKASASILKKPGELGARAGGEDEGTGRGRVVFEGRANPPEDGLARQESKPSKSPRPSLFGSLSRRMSQKGTPRSRKGSPGSASGSQRETPLAKYAVKVVLKEGLDTQIKREDFCRELAIHKELSGKCRYIVELMEVLEDDDAVYLVLELCRGGELLGLVRDHGRLREASAKLILVQVASAVAFCHSQNVLHRDIKLENILFDLPAGALFDETPAMAAGALPRATAKLADFGLSVRLPKGATSTECVGSKQFQAPEMLKGWRYGPRVDVWSLGVVLYAMLSGRLPFTGESAEDEAGLKKAILAGKLQLESDTWQGVSSEAKDLLQKMLTQDPLKRIQAAAILEHPWLADVAEKEAPVGAETASKSGETKNLAQQGQRSPRFCCIS